MNINQKGFANIVLVVVIVILVGLVGYFAFVKKSEPTAQQPTPTQTTTQTNTPTPTPTPKDETSNWKTYTDDNSSYSLKYPSTLKITSVGDAGHQLISLNLDSNTHYSFDTRENNPQSLSQDSIAITNFISYPSNESDLAKWRSSWEPSGLNSSATYKTMTINGYSALEEKTSKFKTVYILHDNNIFEFSVIPYNSSNEQLFDKILATLKFF